MTQPLKLVSYVLVNWNTEQWLERALESIEEQSYPLREVILVNNASPAWNPTLARGRELQLITLPENLGFAAGNNVGIEAAQGDVVVLLNCDAWLDPNFTKHALETFDSNPRIGTVVPKILRGDQSGLLDSTGHVMRTDRTCFNRGHGERDQGQYDAGGFVFGGQAAAIAYRRDMLDAVTWRGQAFDERFFAYFEDVDLDWRAKIGGWLAYYDPRCLAWHMSAGSGGRSSRRIQRRAEKNRYLMLMKCDSLVSQISCLPELLLYETYHLLTVLAKPWAWPSIFECMAALPETLRWRKRVLSTKVISPEAISAAFIHRGDTRPPRTIASSTDSDAGGHECAVDAGFPLVSVIVVNYNGLHLSRACIDALLAQSYENIEVILVDNGSDADEAALIGLDHAGKAEASRVRTLRLEQNLGFSGGVNWGVSLARGELIALVNNDCMPDGECIRKMVYALRRTGAAAVSGRLVNVGTAQEAAAALRALDAEHEDPGDVVWDLPDPIKEAFADSYRHHGLSLYGYSVTVAYAEPACFYPSGGLCCLRREAIAELLPELLPHDYFAYHEDTALGLALHLRGKPVIKEPSASAVHLEGSTARKLGSMRLRYLQERNRWRNILTCYPAAVIAALLPLLCLQSIGALFTLLPTRPPEALGIAFAHIWLATHPMKLLAERRLKRKRGTGSDHAWLSQLSSRTRAGRLADWLSLGWCRLLHIPCRELTN